MKPYYQDDYATIFHGDCMDVLKTLPAESINCCVTSPPYWGLRDYGVDGQLGLENSPEEYVANMVAVFAEVKRVLRDDGTLWLNLGDSYNGSGHKEEQINSPKQTSNRGATSQRGTSCTTLKPKDLVGIPWRVAFALQADGWYLRQDIIWHKPNTMPESVTDRCTKAHEYIFLLSKSKRYYYDAEAIGEPQKKLPGKAGNKYHPDKVSGPNDRKGHSQWETSMDRVWGDKGWANKRSVWTVTTKAYSGAHFAVFPPDLIRPCILAGCPVGGTVLDPFGGSGTVAEVCKDGSRKCVSIELNEDYITLQKKRLQQEVMNLGA